MKGIVLLMFLGVVASACNTKKQPTFEDQSTETEKLYFGQHTPSLIPEIFAPGVVSIEGRYEHGISFSIL
ncbi:MAG: hypothetical protein AAFY00_09155 [Bacteroidota bacterium]